MPHDVSAIRSACTRFLAGHGPDNRAPARVLAQLAELAVDTKPDHYGRGPVIADFEAHVAELLGKPAAVFLPSGTQAQPIALKLWALKAGVGTVAFHPTCHLELHEHHGYRHLYGLDAALLGPPNALMTAQDVRDHTGPVAALLVELPQRELGGILPTWDALVALTDAARARGWAVHLDGARLWECGPYYQRSPAQIAALFDTVYVSFYKGLGGVAGAMLAGPTDVMEDARIWKRRAGGDLICLYPYVLSAQHALATRLPRMDAYHQHARALVAALSQVDGAQCTPAHTNMFHLTLTGDRDRLWAAALDVAAQHRIWLLGHLRATPGGASCEISVGDASLHVDPALAAQLVAQVVHAAR
jgi:threonine aldolase